MPLRDPAADAAETRADAQARHVNARGERARAAAMIIRDQGQRGGQIRRLAQAHERTHDDELLETSRMTREPRQQRPHEQAAR